MDFYNEYGQVVCNSEMKISIKYLSGKTSLAISTKGQENAEFLEQYFTDNGIRLSVVEIF